MHQLSFLSIPASAVFYLAGIIDGEGSIQLMKPRKSAKFRCPAVTVTSTTREIIDFCKGYLGGDVSKVTKTKEHHKQAWHWMLRGDKALEFLKAIEGTLLDPKKRMRAELLTSEYKKITLRNGKYTPEQARIKLHFEERFFLL